MFEYEVPEAMNIINSFPKIISDGTTIYQEIFESLFQSGWFVVSLWTQVLIIHVIRTKKIPFVQSIASKQVLFSTIIAGILGTIIPFTSFGYALQMINLPFEFFILLIAVIIGYLVLSGIWKNIYIKKFGELL